MAQILNIFQKFSDIIWSLVGYTNDLFKLIAWVTLVVTAVVLFGKQIRAGFLIRKFFRTKGIGFVRAFMVPFLSRNDCNRNTQLFIEYIILSTTDTFLNGDKWKRKILDFRAEYIEKKDKNSIRIDNTFILKNNVVKSGIDDYFEFLRKHQDALNISNNDIDRFKMEIIIENAYLTPLIQISSLQERYNEDWSKVLDHYAFEFTDKNNKRMPTEVASFYTWLMWGPSVCVIPDSDEIACKMCLLGLGDESMSIPVVIPANQELSVWKTICKKIEDNEFGTFVKGKYILYDKKSYLNNNKKQFSGVTLNFVDAETLESESGLLLETTTDIEEVPFAKHANTMFSAYIWIMLHYTKKDNNKQLFDTHNATVFFEHANISDSENVKLYTTTLINKCMEYLRQVKNNPDYSDREYSVPWAVNKKIVEEFKEAVSKAEDLNGFVRFDGAKVTQESILNSVDNAFKVDAVEIGFTDIDFNNPADLGLLGRFYCELYMIEFPDEDERESLENIIEQGKRMHPIKECEYHCIIATQGDEIIGGILGDYFAECNSAACEFVVVNSKKRNLHVGSRLINRLIDSCNTDANIYDNKLRTIDYCFFECENPYKVTPDKKEQCISRLKFWDRKKAKRIDIDYIQTSLEESKQAVPYLYLCSIVVNNDKFNDETVRGERVMKFIECYFKYAFSKENVHKNSEYIQMLNENKHRDNINLLSLV